MKDSIRIEQHASASLITRGAHIEPVRIHGCFEVTCFDKDGWVKWRDVIKNIVTTVGKNDVLDKYLKGSTYTQTIRMGLKGTGSTNAADTQASHAGWSEVGGSNAPAYTGNRKDVTMGAASAGSSVSPTQSFAITSSGTVAGCFINNGGSATKDDTTGVLYSVGNFTGGDKVVANGDTLNVVYTATLT